MKQFLLKVWMTAALSLLVVGGVWGQAPTVGSLSPADGATGVSLTDDLVVTFDQDIRFGSEGFWWIRVKEYNSENTFESFIVSGEDTNEKLSISNNQLLISHNQFVEGVRYYVTIASGAIESLGGVGFGGLSSKDEWDFTTETLPSSPIVSAFLPLDGATGVSLTDDLVVTFDQDIRFGSEGFWWVRIKEYNSENTFESFIVSGEDTNQKLSISNNQLLISHNQFVEGVRYYVTIASGAIESLGGVGFGGLSSKDEWSFTTVVAAEPPGIVLSSLSPAKDAVEVSRAPVISLQFDRPIQWGVEGLFRIRAVTGGGIATTVSPGEEGATISSDLLSIEFTSPRLAYGTEYYVEITNDFVRAVDGEASFPGISLNDGWTFTTETAPPFWEVGYPNISNQTVTDFQFNAWADNTGVYYGVVTMSSTAPSVEQIEQGLNQGGTSARIAFNEMVSDNTNPMSTFVSFNSNTELGNTYFLHAVYKSGSKYSDVETITIDRVVPGILSSYPVAGEIVFPIEDALEINFTEAVVGADGNPLDASHFSFKLKDEISTVDFSISVVTESEMTKVVLTPTTALIEDTTYTITISEVYDLSGNPSDPVSITFETDGVSTWTGGGNSSDWSDPLNWGGVDFVQYKSVVIQSGSSTFPEITTGIIDVHNLTIEPGAVLTHTGGTLNVAGKLLLQSDTDGNASYIKTGGTLNVDGDSVRVEQYFGNPILTFLISSPTKGTSAANFGGYYPLSVYDNKTDTWPNVGIQETMSPGIGYRMWTLDNLVYFSGQLNSESITIDLTRTNGKGYGWNLVGNPYPAGLDWSLLDVDENSLVQDNFWLWMPTDKKYGAYSVATDIPINIESSVIPSNHAFLVKVKLNNSEASLTFNPSAQVVSSGNYLKSASGPSVPYVKLAGVSGSVKDEMAVAFIDDASFTDDKYDLEKRFANQQSVFELYTNAGSVQAAINAIPLNGTYTLPLGYNALKSGSYGIEMVRDNTDNVSCVLIDKELGVERVMSRGDKYEFAVNKAEKTINRFELKFTNIITSNKPINQSQLDFELFSKDQGIYISYNPSDVTMNFEIIDIYGRALGAGVLSGNHNVLLGVFDKGVYIVRITDDTGRVSESRKVAVY